MKRLLYILFVAAPCIVTQGQTKPDAVKLNPEASAGVIQTERDLANENARHDEEIKRIRDLQSAYLKGAGVPLDYQCGWDLRVSPIVTCAKPKQEAKAAPK